MLKDLKKILIIFCLIITWYNDLSVADVHKHRQPVGSSDGSITQRLLYDATDGADNIITLETAREIAEFLSSEENRKCTTLTIVGCAFEPGALSLILRAKLRSLKLKLVRNVDNTFLEELIRELRINPELELEELAINSAHPLDYNVLQRLIDSLLNKPSGWLTTITFHNIGLNDADLLHLLMIPNMRDIRILEHNGNFSDAFLLHIFDENGFIADSLRKIKLNLNGITQAGRIAFFTNYFARISENDRPHQGPEDPTDESSDLGNCVLLINAQRDEKNDSCKQILTLLCDEYPPPIEDSSAWDQDLVMAFITDISPMPSREDFLTGSYSFFYLSMRDAVLTRNICIMKIPRDLLLAKYAKRREMLLAALFTKLPCAIIVAYLMNNIDYKTIYNVFMLGDEDELEYLNREERQIANRGRRNEIYLMRHLPQPRLTATPELQRRSQLVQRGRIRPLPIPYFLHIPSLPS